jgi:hypothetical protein
MMQKFKQLPLLFFALLALANTLTAPQTLPNHGSTTALYSNVSGGSVSNTTAETSIFTGATGASGMEGRTIKASTDFSGPVAGTVYRVKAFGNINTTGTPTLQLKVKLGATTIADTGAVTMANNTNGRFFLEFDILVTVVGAGGSVHCFPLFEYAALGGGGVTQLFHVAAAATSINWTSSQTIDITFQWSAASASNSITLFGLTIERVA